MSYMVLLSEGLRILLSLSTSLRSIINLHVRSMAYLQIRWWMWTCLHRWQKQSGCIFELVNLLVVSPLISDQDIGNLIPPKDVLQRWEHLQVSDLWAGDRSFIWLQQNSCQICSWSCEQLQVSRHIIPQGGCTRQRCHTLVYSISWVWENACRASRWDTAWSWHHLHA